MKDNSLINYNIVRELKYIKMMYSDDTHEFLVQTLERDDNDNPIVTGQIVLSKVYAFSLLRFIVRFAQRNWFRRKK